MRKKPWNMDQRALALGCLRNYTRAQINDMIQELVLGRAKDERPVCNGKDRIQAGLEEGQ